MSFTPIVANSVTYNERAKGIYIPSTLVYGDPRNEIIVRPNTNSKQPSTTIQRVRQVVSGTDPLTAKRLTMLASISLQMPNDSVCTPTIMAGLVSDLAVFLTAANIGRAFMGEA